MERATETRINRITPRRAASCCIAEYAGPHSEEIEMLFGVTALTTAFGPQADPDCVLAGIRGLNPLALVELA
jgi:hypothetical protein